MTAETTVIPYTDENGFTGRIFVGENPTVHAYIKGPGPETFLVTVKAPIITDGNTQEGVQPLLDFVAAIEAHPNTAIAAEEAERLQPWFSAASVYLTRALKKAEVAQEKEQLKGLLTPGALKKAFNDVADCTRVTLTSDVVIMPYNTHWGPAQHLFERAFNPTFRYGDHPFSFGFIQLFEEGKNPWRAKSSTTIPTFMLDTKLMEEIAPHQPAELYRRLQIIVTDMNHDMLHHLHSFAITDTVAAKFDPAYRDTVISKWGRSIVGGTSRIEEWSQISHGKIFMAPGNEHLVKEVGANLNHYFDELARIGKALPKDMAHEVVDYFGTVVAQTLSRTFPLNHPLMTQCLNRLQAIDPLSETELREKTLAKYGDVANWPLITMPEARAIMSERTIDIIRGYRQQGLDLLPDDDNHVGFRELKLLQLVMLEPEEMQSHVPMPVGADEQKVRADSDRAFLDLVSAVAKTTPTHRPK